jgi:septum formation protein
MTRVILASRSPRRTQVLDMLGVKHHCVPSGAPEEPLRGESPQDQVIRLAGDKARAVARREPEFDLVIAADTLVALGGQVLGQPVDQAEASVMLRSLSGATHTVFSGIFLMTKGGLETSGLSESRVTFHDLTDQEIAWYLGTGEAMDKAGAYAAQGAGAVFIRSIEGSFHNVVGFPIDLFYRLLPDVGVSLQELRDEGENTVTRGLGD